MSQIWLNRVNPRILHTTWKSSTLADTIQYLKIRYEKYGIRDAIRPGLVVPQNQTGRRVQCNTNPIIYRDPSSPETDLAPSALPHRPPRPRQLTSLFLLPPAILLRLLTADHALALHHRRSRPLPTSVLFFGFSQNESVIMTGFLFSCKKKKKICWLAFSILLLYDVNEFVDWLWPWKYDYICCISESTPHHLSLPPFPISAPTNWSHIAGIVSREDFVSPTCRRRGVGNMSPTYLDLANHG